MPEPLTYEEKVIDTFRKTALRTVLMIDDQFPTFSDLVRAHAACDTEGAQCGLSALDAKFSECERALRLYEMFREHDMPCDIENSPDVDTDKDVERIRKSDLVVVDYNLDGVPNDNGKSIKLLTKLAQTSHFNTVVLYTNDPRLDLVWFDVAFSLRGGWIPPDQLLGGNTLEVWENLLDAETPLPQVSNELVKRHLVAGREGWRGWKEERSQLDQELLALGFSRDQCTGVIEALIHRAVRERLGDKTSSFVDRPRWLSGRCEDGKPIWLQAGNCFIAIMGKRRSTADGSLEDNDDIIGYLDEALTNWRPNLLQIIISEIQNILELEALATDELHLQNPEMQAGLFYYLLQMASGLPVTDDGLSYTPAIESIIDKLVENIRQKISFNGVVASDAARLLREELKEAAKWPLNGRSEAKDIFKLATGMTRSSINPKQDDTIFKLNAFLNSEEFRLGNLTTGTIVRSCGTEDYWVFLSPACDMVPRQPNDSQHWANALFPLRAFASIKILKGDSITSALGEAELGQNMFLEIDGTPVVFKLLDPKTKQPSYEILFPDNEGRVDISSGTPRFYAFRLLPVGANEDGKREMKSIEFEVVGQLRHRYANRFLQMLGQHTTRIGVDFINLPS